MHGRIGVLISHTHSYKYLARLRHASTYLRGLGRRSLGQVPLAVPEKVHVRIQLGEEAIALLAGGAAELERFGDVVGLRMRRRREDCGRGRGEREGRGSKMGR